MPMEELRNALDTDTGGVGNVIPEDLEPVLVEYLYKISPLLQLIPKKRAEGKVHEVAKRTDVPDAWVEGELTTPSPVNSTYGRDTVQMKIARISGGVSNFAQAATTNFIDLLASEQEAAVEAMATMMEFGLMWGNATADAYQFSGVDTFITENQPSHVQDVDGVVSLSVLDNMIDTVEQYRGVARDPKVFVASNRMISKISGLETRVGIDLTDLEFEGGLRMTTYRGYPLLPAHYVRPTVTSPTVTATAAAGGSLASGTYFYKIAAVTFDGEQIAGAADSAASDGTTNQTIDLSWSANANAKLYKIYRTGADEADSDANYDLLTTIAAQTYDANGAVSGNVTSFSDDGSYTPVTEVHPLASGDETIWLLDFNEVRGYSMLWLPNTAGRSLDGTMLRYHELGKTKSSVDFMIEAFIASQLPWAQTCTVARRVSTA